MIAALPLIAKGRDARPVELLRHLATQDASWLVWCSHLGENPERFLDVIFITEEADQPDPDALDTARGWIPKLGDETYARREEAFAFLARMETAARPSLEEAAAHEDPEIRSRAERLLARLADRPRLKDLDYGNVVRSVTTIVARTKDDAMLEALVAGGLERMGQPTAHGREAWLLKPVLREMVKRGGGRSRELMQRALQSPDPNLALNAVAAIGEATASAGLNEIHIDALSTLRPDSLDTLLVHTPALNGGDALVSRYRRTLLDVSSAESLPEATRLGAHRLLLVAFHAEDSLKALVDAARRGEETICLQALSDLRLVGIPLAGSERAAVLIDHPSAEIRQAAGIFLLTRPDAGARKPGLAFLPHIGEASDEELKAVFGAIIDSGSLRETLEEIAAGNHPHRTAAARVLACLPRGEFRMEIPHQNPFGFR